MPHFAVLIEVDAEGYFARTATPQPSSNHGDFAMWTPTRDIFRQAHDDRNCGISPRFRLGKDAHDGALIQCAVMGITKRPT